MIDARKGPLESNHRGAMSKAIKYTLTGNDTHTATTRLVFFLIILPPFYRMLGEANRHFPSRGENSEKKRKRRGLNVSSRA